MISDKQHFQAMLHGNDLALRSLLSSYHNYLVVVGLRYLSDRQRVEDVIHDTFADLWNKQKDIEVQSVKSFLRGAIVNKCLAIIRKERRIDLVDDHSHDIASNTPTPDQYLDRAQLEKEILKIIAQLPSKCQQVFKLSRFDGRSHQEISDKMGISKKTIENHMTKALRTLRDQLKRKDLLLILLWIVKTYK